MSDLSARDVQDALIRTAMLNRPLGLGSPYGPGTYDVQSALRLLKRATRIRRTTWHGQAVVEAFLPGYGWHGWYVHDRPLHNPWE